MKGEPLEVAGLFAGIGGIERGLGRAGHRTEFLCEIDPGARAVLREHFPRAELHAEVRDLGSLPDVDLVTAGFPCKDLSQAGGTAGIDGASSSLVGEVFRLLDDSSHDPDWLLFENVPFMLRLDRGRAMRVLVAALERRDYQWAYRTVDTRAFGIPHRRERVLVLASRELDPAAVLYRTSVDPVLPEYEEGRACGFYWTEGRSGVGWAVEAVPPLKAGSGVGIPSPPAMWLPDREADIFTPALGDAERLQGFPSGWTAPATEAPGVGHRDRWALVGNAVSVPVAEWLGRGLAGRTDSTKAVESRPLSNDESWPTAAYGRGGSRYAVEVSTWPSLAESTGLDDFLEHEPELLSRRAAAGFLSRAGESNLSFEPGFLEAVGRHVRFMKEREAA